MLVTSHNCQHSLFECLYNLSDLLHGFFHSKLLTGATVRISPQSLWLGHTALVINPQPSAVYNRRLFITIIAYLCNGAQESGEERKPRKWGSTEGKNGNTFWIEQMVRCARSQVKKNENFILISPPDIHRKI